MKVDNWNDLSAFGIYVLTGEADAYGLRLLCDVTQEGKDTLSAFFGSPELAVAAPWNGNGIGSVMLPRSVWEDLAAFCLLRSGCEVVIVYKNGTIRGYDGTRRKQLDLDETLADASFRSANIDRVVYALTGPRCGDRMVHAMSGRAA